MAHVLLLKKDPSTGQLFALIHRRGRHLREEFCWGVPGGGFERPEKIALRENPGNKEIANKIYIRAALREFIEECGGGYHPTYSPGEVTVDPIPECALGPVPFYDVLVPRRLVSLLRDPSCCRLMKAHYGSNKARHTQIIIYMLHSESEGSFARHWKPRAISRYRCEIDETYPKGGCEYGYKWVPLDRLFTCPERPIDGSTKPLCDFLVNFFRDGKDEILGNILELSSEPMELCNQMELKIIHPVQPISSDLGQRINKGTYSRLRFDQDVDSSIADLTFAIQSLSEGRFFSQLDSRAGLGCHPFHITLCSRLYLSRMTFSDVVKPGGIFDTAATLFPNVLTSFYQPGDEVTFLGMNKNLYRPRLQFLVQRSGRVSLKLFDVANCLAIGSFITSRIPGCNGWYTERECNLHVTIGHYTGDPNFIDSFKDFLHDHFGYYFTTEGRVHPEFLAAMKAQHIELSEEARVSTVPILLAEVADMT